MITRSIILATLNARYIHAAFGIRCLFANLDELQNDAVICEFTINQEIEVIGAKLLEYSPKIIGLGVYIWNAKASLNLVKWLKEKSPHTVIILGGPEVSYECEAQEICHIADYTIRGEGDLAFRDLCREVLLSRSTASQKWLQATLPELSLLQSPYPFYTDGDIQHRVIYVEASRGCPYKCEYCLSSLDLNVRNFDTARFLSEMDLLIKRGVKQFKFIDRTFNLSPKISTRILEFFLDRVDQNLFLHFEMVPDRLPIELRSLISKFPDGRLQFEIGVQTWNPEVAKRVSRKQDYEKIKDNFKFLKEQTGVHIHADLIAGLPGETLESFAQGFDALYDLGPQEIQVGILKRLRGAPISKHSDEWKMVYQESAPYLILRSRTMSASQIEQMARFSKFWDLVINSGRFERVRKCFDELKNNQNEKSMFALFNEYCDFVRIRFPETYGIPLEELAESLRDFLAHKNISKEESDQILFEDFTQGQTRKIPNFLNHLKKSSNLILEKVSSNESNIPERQQRFLTNQATHKPK